MNGTLIEQVGVEPTGQSLHRPHRCSDYLTLSYNPDRDNDPAPDPDPDHEHDPDHPNPDPDHDRDNDRDNDPDPDRDHDLKYPSLKRAWFIFDPLTFN